jgi:hypothetical protein
MAKGNLIPAERIAQAIVLIRGQKVMLDEDLAALYGVQTRRLNEQVRRNLDRFPDDFMFQLTDEEYAALISQIATSKPGRGGRRKLPLAFTEHGAIMAASVRDTARHRSLGLRGTRLRAAARDDRREQGAGPQARGAGASA